MITNKEEEMEREALKEWNMKIIDAVSTVDGTDVMNAVRVVVAWCDI